MENATAINEMVRFGSVDALLLFVDRGAGKTIFFLRVEDPAHALDIASPRASLADDDGQLVAHIASHSGGTGLENYATLAFEAAEGSTLRLRFDDREIIAVETLAPDA